MSGEKTSPTKESPSACGEPSAEKTLSTKKIQKPLSSKQSTIYRIAYGHPGSRLYKPKIIQNLYLNVITMVESNMEKGIKFGNNDKYDLEDAQYRSDSNKSVTKQDLEKELFDEQTITLDFPKLERSKIPHIYSYDPEKMFKPYKPNDDYVDKNYRKVIGNRLNDVLIAIIEWGFQIYNKLDLDEISDEDLIDYYKDLYTFKGFLKSIDPHTNEKVYLAIIGSSL